MLVKERTLAIIKPDAVSRGASGEIITRYEKNGFSIIALKKMHLNKTQAEGFYHVHKERPFFNSLTAFMTGGPVVVLVLQGDDAIKRHRDLMGATDPKKADKGTLRKDFGTDIENNAVHGSDGPDTARFEIGYFFPGVELPSY
ncbi:MAG TPA: nucleoside-diphosphate kinase [Nitrospiria bacterium]